MINPPLKWAGGKRYLLPQLKKDLPKFDDYYEPFLGGGALYFGLQLSRRSYLSDRNRDLIMFYREVRDHPKRFYRLIRKLWDDHSESHYYYIRDRYNETDAVSKKSAYFYYLNKHGFNGLYRVNKSGKFNVPVGRTKPALPSQQDIGNWSSALFKAKLSAKDYTSINPDCGDFVYVNPPYYSTYDQYTPGQFNEQAHIDLSKWVKTLANEEVYVMLSNSNHPLILDLYKDFNITRVVNRRSISQDKTQRNNVEELLIRSF